MRKKYCRARQNAGYLRLQTHTENVEYLLLFHCNSGYVNASKCYVYMYIACLVITEMCVYCAVRTVHAVT